MIWNLWTNTLQMLDVCYKGDTVYFATAGGLVVKIGGDTRVITKTDGLPDVVVLSVACGDVVWILTRRGLYYLRDWEVYQVDLIAFERPDEVLRSKRIRLYGDYLFIQGRDKLMVYRITDATEVQVQQTFHDLRFMDLFADSLVVADRYGVHVVGALNFNTDWGTLYNAREVNYVSKHPILGWLFATDSGIRSLDDLLIGDYTGGVDMVMVKERDVYFSSEDGLYVYRYPPGSAQLLSRDLVSYMDTNYYSLIPRNVPLYSTGLGIFTWTGDTVDTRGMPSTHLVSVIPLGDSLFMCTRALPECFVYPSGLRHRFGISNAARLFNGRIYIALNGGGLVILWEDLSDTVVLSSEDLGDYTYVFDVTYWRDKVYFTAWEPTGNSRVFSIKDTSLEGTPISGPGMNLVLSLDDDLLVCGGVCRVYNSNLEQIAAIEGNVNVATVFLSKLVLGTNQGLKVFSLGDYTKVGEYLTGIQITGLASLGSVLWISGDSGLYALDSNFRVMARYTPENSPLPGYSFSAVFIPIRFSLETDGRRLYVTTTGGLAIIEGEDLMPSWAEDVYVYPNPVPQGFTLKLRPCFGDAQLEIRTLLGNRLKSARGCEVGTSDLQPGLYILVVIGENGRALRKFSVVPRR